MTFYGTLWYYYFLISRHTMTFFRYTMILFKFFDILYYDFLMSFYTDLLWHIILCNFRTFCMTLWLTGCITALNREALQSENGSAPQQDGAAIHGGAQLPALEEEGSTGSTQLHPTGLNTSELTSYNIVTLPFTFCVYVVHTHTQTSHYAYTSTILPFKFSLFFCNTVNHRFILLYLILYVIF